MTLYTCLSDTSIQPVIAAFEKAEPGSTVELFRAPTGQLNALIAADARSGGLADVVWGCDPLTVQLSSPRNWSVAGPRPVPPDAPSTDGD